MSLRAGLLTKWLRLVERPALARLPSHPPQKTRRRFEWQARMISPAPRGSAKQDARVAGVDALTVTGPGGATRRGTLLYFHGGAYVFGSPQSHSGMVARLVGRCGIKAVLPDYPMAPEGPFPAAPDAALAVYRELAQDGPVILSGDSAGGGLALSLLAQIIEQGLPLPILTVVLSPWTDLTMAGASHTANFKVEAVLPPDRIAEARDLYLGGADATDPRASPLFATFEGASPVRIWVGDQEVLFDDSRNMVAHLQGQGVDAAIQIEPGLPHVWPFFRGWMLPEAETTLDQMAAEIQTSLAKASR